MAAEVQLLGKQADDFDAADDEGHHEGREAGGGDVVVDLADRCTKGEWCAGGATCCVAGPLSEQLHRAHLDKQGPADENSLIRFSRSAHSALRG